MISLMKFLGGDKISRRKFLATPDHSYFPICIEAMKLGIHVYVEKPPVRTSYECELFAGGTEVRCYHADELPRTFFLFIIDLKLSKLAKSFQSFHRIFHVLIFVLKV